MQIYIKMYAALKDYFPDVMNIALTDCRKIDDLKNHLSGLQPESSGLLGKCRFAVNHEFVVSGTEFHSGDTVDILPPSSGG